MTDVTRVNTFVTKGVPEINNSLSKQSGPTLMGGKPVKFPAWLSQRSKGDEQ